MSRQGPTAVKYI